MKKVKIKQITSIDFDERFYIKDGKFAPSVTYLLGCVYPTNKGLMRFIGDVGNERAEQIKNNAGDDGSYVHKSIEQILLGKKISNKEISIKFNRRRALKIKRCLKAFLDWHAEYKPETIATEKVIWNDKYIYAGTMDYHCKIKTGKYKGEWIIDFKTSRTIQTIMKVQLSAYNYAETKGKAKQAILHLGNMTKKRYSWLPYDFKPYFEQFKMANDLFKMLNPNARPNNEEFPAYFKLTNE